jgi:hypothetical protein
MPDLIVYIVYIAFIGLIVAGLVLAFNGVVQLCVRKKIGTWKEGGASVLAGAIIVGVSVFVKWLTEGWLSPIWWVSLMWWFFLVAGLVFLFNGVVQLRIRNKSGPWKEGGASLLAGVIIVGVSVLVGWLAGKRLPEMSWGSLMWWLFLTAGLVVAFNGVVKLSVRKKTSTWKEGGASLVIGAIFIVVFVLFNVFFHGLWGL